ncbi:MAG: DUF1573 domain-containing protein [Clostridium sp.]|nr:DUF1573 domain-containing protein [Clostridium sp.]
MGDSIADSVGRRGGRLELKEATVDLGEIKGDSVVTGIFTVYNRGDEPVAIINVFSDCSCTVPSVSKEPIEPGDSVELVVRYDPRKYKYGRFRRIMRIRSTAENPYLTAVLTGTIERNRRRPRE